MAASRERAKGLVSDISRRRVVHLVGGVAATGLAVGVAGGASAITEPTPTASSEASPETTPQPTPTSSAAASPTAERDVSSWFVTSPQQADGGFTLEAETFSVYSGKTLEKLGGFRSPGTVGMCVTADPGRILLATQTGASIFDLRNGKVREVKTIDGAFTAPAWLPDPRVFNVAPERWAVLRAADSSQCWLVDLDAATAVDLVAIFAEKGQAATFPAVAFTLDGALATAQVDEAGAVLFDPEHPEEFRRLDGGKKGSVSGFPVFSDSGEHVAYTVAEKATDVTARLVIQDTKTEGIVSEIDGLSPTVFCTFVPGSESTLLIMGEGASTVVDTATGRDLADVESSPQPHAYGFSSDGKRVLVGSSELSGEEIRWQKLDLTTGEAEAIPELEALTFYNGSYGGNVAYTLFGPPYLAQGEEVVDALVAYDIDAMEATPLLDDVSSWALSYGYSTSADSSIALLVSYDATLMNIPEADVQIFPDVTTGSSSHGSYVSPDGSKAAISAWDSTGSGSQQVLMIDVAEGGKPEPFVDGVLWLWAGAVPEKEATATAGLRSGASSFGMQRISR